VNRELPDDVHESIKRFCAEGDSLAEAARYPDAITRYDQALALLPTPHQDWEAATWIYAALGDTHFLAGANAGIAVELWRWSVPFISQISVVVQVVRRHACLRHHPISRRGADSRK